MAFTNSPLVEYTRISPSKTSPRNQSKITKIIVHHWAGVGTIEYFGGLVANPARQMSPNYAIDKDARVGMFCEEKDRCWCSSSPWADHRGIAIEVSNCKTGEPWPVSDKVFDKLVDLCADICLRNDIPKLEFTGDLNGSLLYHYMTAPANRPTGCPQAYLKGKTNELCRRVNEKINAAKTPEKKPDPIPVVPTDGTIKAGDLVGMTSNAVYYNGSAIPDWVKKTKWYVDSVQGDRAVLGHDISRTSNIQSPINTKYLVDGSTNANPVKIGTACNPYTVTLPADAAIYGQPGGKVTGSIGGKGGVFTITSEYTINGTKYGLLKSGAGWVIVPNAKAPTAPTTTTFKKGDTVKVTNATQYNGKPFVKYVDVYTVLEVSGDRAVISSDGKNVTCAINTKNITKVG